MKCDTKICFHGAFGTKAKAKAKERKVNGFVRRIKINGKARYVVMTKKGKR